MRVAAVGEGVLCCALCWGCADMGVRFLRARCEEGNARGVSQSRGLPRGIADDYHVGKAVSGRGKRLHVRPSNRRIARVRAQVLVVIHMREGRVLGRPGADR